MFLIYACDIYVKIIDIYRYYFQVFIEVLLQFSL